MPKENQKTITISRDVYDRAEVMRTERKLRGVATLVTNLINKEWERGEIA